MEQFNALTGPELKKVLLDKVSKELDQQLELTGEFKENLTFPWIRYEISIKLLVYPKDDMKSDPKEIGKVEGEIQNATEFTPAVGAVSESLVTLRVGDVINTPDKAREESGIPIPAQAPGPGVVRGVPVQVDKPVPSKGFPLKGGK